MISLKKKLRTDCLVYIEVSSSARTAIESRVSSQIEGRVYQKLTFPATHNHRRGFQVADSLELKARKKYDQSKE